jgi:TRAP-type uncharacterized transport system fused permease subunit
MLSSLEKHWPLISIVLLVFLLASLWLWPEIQGMLSLVIIIISVGMLLVFTVHRRLEENYKGLIDRTTMNRLIILDCVGILLVLVSAMYVGSLVSKVIGEKVYKGMQESAPQWAEGVAIMSSLLAALVAGVGVGWLVRSIWGRLERTQVPKLS